MVASKLRITRFAARPRLICGLAMAILIFITMPDPTCKADMQSAPAGPRGVFNAELDLAQRLGCFACHGEGQGKAAPSLKGSGSRLTREQLQVVLVQPRRLYPGARMPSYAYLPQKERQELLDFLERLK